MVEDNPPREYQSSIPPAVTGCSKNIKPTKVAPKLLVSGQPLEIQSSNDCSSVDIVPDPEDAHLQQGGEDVSIRDFVQDSSSGTSQSQEKSSIDFLPCSTDFQDELPKVEMAPQPDDAHPQQGDDVNIADFVQDSSSGTSQSQEKSSIDFLPCSTDFQDELPKVEMAPRPDDAHPQQGDDVNIADFVQDSSSGTSQSQEKTSIDFLPCSTDFQDELPKVEMAPQLEDAHHAQGDEDINITDFVQAGISQSSFDFLPCFTDFQDKLSKVDKATKPKDTHLPQGDENVNIADFVQESTSGTLAKKSSIDFHPCSKGFQDNLPKVDQAQQPEDARLPQGDKNVNITDFVHDSSSEMSKLLDILPCSMDFQGELPTVDMAPQPKDDHLPTGGEAVKIADFVQDIPSGMYTTVKSSIDFPPCCTDFQDKLQKVDIAPQLEDAHHAECDEVNIADFVQDSLSAEKSIDFLPCSTDLQDKLPKADMVPESTARHDVVNDPSFNGGRQQDIPETPQGDNLNFGSEQLNQLTLRAAKENEKKSNLSESVPEDTSPHSVYSSSIFLFLLPCLLLILSILLFFFRSSRNLLGLILCLILTILLCPYKVFRLTWRYFYSLSRRHRRVTGGTKPVSKKHDHSLTHDSTSTDQHSTDMTVLEASCLKEESSSKSRIQHKENRGILLRCMSERLFYPPTPSHHHHHHHHHSGFFFPLKVVAQTVSRVVRCFQAIPARLIKFSQYLRSQSPRMDSIQNSMHNVTDPLPKNLMGSEEKAPETMRAPAKATEERTSEQCDHKKGEIMQ